MVLDFYASGTKDPTGYGEGEVWIGSSGLMTDTVGKGSFSVTLTNRIAVTGFISATATDAAYGTSEFSSSIAVAAPAAPDSDGDGMPDDYELAWGFATNNPADAALDLDGDGKTNRDEYLAGTSPRDASDRLRITALGVGEGQAWLWFLSVPGKRYHLEAAGAVAGSWQPIGNQLSGTGSFLGMGDNWSGNPSARFYRVVCP
jgi:hypothetical protein